MKRLILLTLAALALTACATSQPLPNRFPYIYLRDSLSLSAFANYRLRVALRDTGWGISDLNESLFNLIWAGGGSGTSTGQNNVAVSKNGAGVSFVAAKTDTTLWFKRLKGSAMIEVTDMGDSVMFSVINPVISSIYLVGYTGAAGDTVYVYTKGGWRTMIGGGTGGSSDSAARAYTAIALRSITGTAGDSGSYYSKRGTWVTDKGGYGVPADSARKAFVSDSMKNKRAVGYAVTDNSLAVGVGTDSLGLPAGNATPYGKIGHSSPMYVGCIQPDAGYPYLGFNSYYGGSGWAFGMSSDGYGAYSLFTPSTGLWEYYASTTSGSGYAALTGALAFSVTRTGIATARNLPDSLLLAQITLDSSRVWTSDTTNMGYTQSAVTVTRIVLFANSAVNVTPRFMFNDTLGGVMTSIITSPAALTTNRTFVSLTTLNNVTVPAGNGFFVMFDAYTTIPRTLTLRIYGYRNL